MEQTETPHRSARIRRRLGPGILAGGLIAALTLGGLGAVDAQTGSSTTTDPAQSGAWADGSHRRGGAGRHHHRRAKLGLATAAKAIGISAADLGKELRAGKSIAQVAAANDVDVKKVIDALVAEAKARLAAKVAAGELTQARADQKLATLSERISDHVNRTRLDRCGEGPRPHRRDGSPSQPKPAAPDA